MRTITFYSYKGGVGRSLALSNIAARLSEYNKKVCVLDFDLEAPGLHFKFKNYTKPTIEKGIVDYIHKFSCEGQLPEKIKDYSIVLTPPNKFFEPINFIAAGDIDSSEYWKKLSMIRWADMFYSEGGEGIKFFLDLKSKIEKEFKPDFLLIDSRTGITDIAGITLRVLADEVVVLAANNEENMYGSKKIIKSLLDKSNALFGNVPKINFVLTRLPYTDKGEDRLIEYVVTDIRKNEFKKHLEINDFEITVIHSDRRLEENEQTLIGDDYEDKGVSISNDYLKLFDRLTKDVLSPEEVETFKRKRYAEKEFNKAKEENGISKKIQYIDRAIELDSTKFEYFSQRGILYYKNKDYNKALQDFNKVVELNPNDWDALHYLGTIYRKYIINEELSLLYLNKSININKLNTSAYNDKCYLLQQQGKLEDAESILNYVLENINPNDAFTLNSRADLYRIMKKYDKAIIDIYKAIELDSEKSLYFGTLAEICDGQNKKEEFYLNLTIALSKGINAETLNSARDIYEKYRKEERFINLINRYEIDIEEIFSEDVE